MEHGHDDLERIAHAVVHLAQQQRALGGQRLEPVAGGADLLLGRLVGLADAHVLDRAVERRAQKLDEVALDFLDDIVGRARLQGGDGNAAFLGAGDVDHRRGIGEGADGGQRLQPVLAGHEMVQRHGLDVALLQQGETLRPAGRQRHVVAHAGELAPHQAPEAGIVVDIEHAHARLRRPGVGRGLQGGGLASVGHHCSYFASGTWMTEKNRPSWRMALAKFS